MNEDDVDVLMEMQFVREACPQQEYFAEADTAESIARLAERGLVEVFGDGWCISQDGLACLIKRGL